MLCGSLVVLRALCVSIRERRLSRGNGNGGLSGPPAMDCGGGLPGAVSLEIRRRNSIGRKEDRRIRVFDIAEKGTLRCGPRHLSDPNSVKLAQVSGGAHQNPLCFCVDRAPGGESPELAVAFGLSEEGLNACSQYL